MNLSRRIWWIFIPLFILTATIPSIFALTQLSATHREHVEENLTLQDMFVLRPMIESYQSLLSTTGLDQSELYVKAYKAEMIERLNHLNEQSGSHVIFVVYEDDQLQTLISRDLSLELNRALRNGADNLSSVEFPDWNWTIHILVDTRHLEAQTTSLWLSLIGSVIVVLILVLLFARRALGHLLTRPVGQLIAASDAMADLRPIELEWDSTYPEELRQIFDALDKSGNRLILTQRETQEHLDHLVRTQALFSIGLKASGLSIFIYDCDSLMATLVRAGETGLLEQSNLNLAECMRLTHSDEDAERMIEALKSDNAVIELQVSGRTESGGIKWCQYRTGAAYEENDRRLNTLTCLDVSWTISVREQLKHALIATKDEHFRAEVINEELRTHQAELVAQNEELGHALKSIESAEVQYRTLFNASSAGYAIIDEVGNILDVNARFVSMVSKPRRMLEGKPLVAYLKMQASLIKSASFRRYGTHSDKVNWIRSLLLIKPGEYLPVRFSLTALESDSEFKALVVVVDITSEVEAEAIFEEAMHLKERFIANMSHEVRTPLHGVVGNVSLVLEEPNLSKEAREELETAERSGRHLARLIDDILDYSKLEARSFKLKPVACNLGQLIQASEATFRPKAQNKGLEIVLNLPSNGPDVIADPINLRRVFDNLIGNAVKFTASGKVTIDLSWKPDSDNEYGDTRFCVKDTGIGIPDTDVDTLFEPFVQIQNGRTKEFEGTGLGLSITKALVDLMRGSIQAQSLEDVGSQFTVKLRLPVSTDPVASQNCKESLVPVVPEESKIPEGTCVLVVDDSPVNRLLVSKMCESLGLRVISANDGQDALDVLVARGAEIEMVLMDIQMPVMDGLQATRIIREDQRHLGLPIIAVTANTQPEDRALCIETGMDDLLPKPFDRGELVAMLNKTWISNKSRANP